MIPSGFVGVDRVTHVAPLGLRLWDPVAEAIVGEGLTVQAAPAADPRRRITAFTNLSGVHVFRDLPGLRQFEHGPGEAAFWPEHPPALEFVIEVTDDRRRFQPFSLKTRLPVRGLLGWDCDPSGSSLPRGIRAVPLFSAPARAVPGALAVVRAELWDAVAQAPAAWALVEVRVAVAHLAWGLADARGRVALIFAYPEAPAGTIASPPGSPPFAAGASLLAQTWHVHLRAYYAPSEQVLERPDLCDVFRQPIAALWADSGLGRPLAAQTLQFGRELIVQSAGGGPDGPRSVLWITPGGSPP